VLGALPLTPNGKVDARALPRPTELTHTASSAYVPPRNPVEAQLAAVWEAFFQVRPVGVTDDFFALGGHSLLAVRLMAHIREETGHSLPLATLFQGATIERLALAIAGEPGAAPAAWSPLVTIQPGASGHTPLFCVPGAGGNVIYFHDLARHLGPERPVHGLQARGLDGTTPPHESVEEMAACYVEAIRAVRPHGPYALAGHSFGSWVAFEMSQQLLRAGEPVALLAIFNSPIPRLELDDDRGEPAAAGGPAFDDAAWMASLANSVGRLYGADLDVTAEAMRPLDPEARYRALAERLIAARILPPGTDSALVRGLVQVYKAAYRIDYVARDPAPVPVVFFRAAQPHEDDGEVPKPIARQPAWGWNRLATGPVPVEPVPGDHMTMMAEPRVRHLAERLRHHLGRALESDRPCP
jgi:thioesterase domain-containing protein